MACRIIMVISGKFVAARSRFTLWAMLHAPTSRVNIPTVCGSLPGTAWDFKAQIARQLGLSTSQEPGPGSGTETQMLDSVT